MTSKTIKSQLILLVLLFGVAVASLNLFFLWGLTKWVEDFIFENLLFQESKRMSFDSEGQASPDGLNRQSFISGSSVEAFPEAWQGWIATLGPGMHEQADGVSLMVLVQEMPDGALHYLVLDTSQLEYVESNVGTVISFAALVIVLTVAGAVITSAYFISLVVKPLERLTHVISESDPGSPMTELEGHFGSEELNQVAAAFVAMQDRVRAFVRRERRFTGDVSHELRTPLTVCHNALELMESSPLAAQHLRYVERISRSLRRMESLVETFLALSRESTHVERRSDTASLSDLIKESIEYHSNAYPYHSAVLEMNLSREVLVIGPRSLWSILVRNLVVNAVLHSPDHRVVVRADSQFAILANTVHCSQPIDGGSGLGLAIAERVAEILGFALLIERDANQFTVRVPLESQAPASAISVPGGGVPLDGMACR